MYETDPTVFYNNLLNREIFVNKNGIIHFSMSHTKSIIDTIVSRLKY